MDFSVKLTKRTRKRKLTSGAIVLQDRYVLNYVDPKSGGRKQAFFEKKKEAEARQRELMNQVSEGTYVDPKAVPTIAEAIDHWLSTKTTQVKPSTLLGYKIVANCIRGPILDGSPKERFEFTANGTKPKGANFVAMLGPLKLTDLTTAAIRAWHRTLVEMVGNYTANRAKAHLKSILALAEEDFGVRAPSMPTGLQRQKAPAPS